MVGRPIKTIDVNEPTAIQSDGTQTPDTDFFEYLGSTLSADGGTHHEVVTRLVHAALLKWCLMTGMLCDKKINLIKVEFDQFETVPSRYSIRVWR